MNTKPDTEPKCEYCHKVIIWDEDTQVSVDGKHYHWGCEPNGWQRHTLKPQEPITVCALCGEGNLPHFECAEKLNEQMLTPKPQEPKSCTCAMFATHGYCDNVPQDTPMEQGWEEEYNNAVWGRLGPGIKTYDATINFIRTKKAEWEKAERERIRGLLPIKRKSSCGCPPFQSMHSGSCWTEEFPGESIGFNTCLKQVHELLSK